jgi:glucose/arabinose dehydrogenase
VVSTALAVLTGGLVIPLVATPGWTAQLPAGFQETTAFSGLIAPVNMEFAPDGRVFVAEKAGRIKVFDGPGDQTPGLFADLSPQVHNYWDRGLLGLALPPDFATNPWVYVLYSYDAPIGGTHPRWGDTCPSPPGPTEDGCVISGRLSRLRANGNVMTGPEQVLINDWCQQNPSHSVGDLAFGPDGALYVTAGEGASFNHPDWGQTKNPCGDPPGPVGANLSPPTAEGGALRSQDIRTLGDPTGLSGSLLRLDPETGAALPTNPMYNATTDQNARRVVAHGLRNPYRMTFRPGTNEVWVGDVGAATWEEINRVPVPTAGLTNFGWPCNEGTGRHNGYDAANLNLCESLYAAGTATGPYFTYNHSTVVVPGENCPVGGGAVSGLAFSPPTGSTYPAAYRGALFFADYSRSCIWAMMPGANGLPDPAKTTTFASDAGFPVDLEIGPEGDLYYVDVVDWVIRRISYLAGNRPPAAAAAATPTSGSTPLAVAFNGIDSADPDGDRLSYAWDFTSDGTVDATGATANYTYQETGTHTATLTVTDPDGASDADTVTIAAGTAPGEPAATIDTPGADLTWAVGDPISFSGHATDGQDGDLAAENLTWRLNMHHCSPSGALCHVHAVETFAGVASGSFTAPDHEYPSYMELQLTATDSDNRTDVRSVRLNPKTVDLTFQTSPAGGSLTVGAETSVTPFTRTLISGSTTTISAPASMQSGGVEYAFNSWSDAGAQTHLIAAPATATTYIAGYGQTAVAGTVTNAATGLPIAGARVDLTPGTRTVRTNSAGQYTFANLAAGTYTVKAGLGTERCGASQTKAVTVDGPEAIDFVLAQRTDAGGYTCIDTTRTFPVVNTTTGLTGNNAARRITLPFGFRYYGQTYTSAWVNTNGALSFTAAGTAAANTAIPSAPAPNAGIYAFWDDLSIDGSASVRTGTLGAAPNRRFVIEWRNALIAGTTQRVNVAVELHQNGEIWLNYKNLATNNRERGSSATVGIENATGSTGLQYSFNLPALTNGVAIQFRPPPT